MNAKNPKTKSTRTIFNKGDGAYVVVRDEGRVRRIYRFHVVKSGRRENFFAESDRARVVLDAAITDVAADAPEFPDVTSGIAEHAWSTQLHPLNDTLER